MPDSRPHSTKLLTPDELAERWRVPKSQVYRLARDGRLPVVCVGRYYRFHPDVIEDWEKRGVRGPSGWTLG